MEGESSSPAAHRVGARPATVRLREILATSKQFEIGLGRELTVNSTDLSALEHIIEDGPLTPNELSRRLNITAAATTTVVDRLVALGHATRCAHPTDRRSVIVVPTEGSVRRAMSRIMPMVMAIDGALDEFDADEQTVIARYLDRVALAYREHD